MSTIADPGGRVHTVRYDANGLVYRYYDPNNNPATVASPKFMENTYRGHQVIKQVAASSTTTEFNRAFPSPNHNVVITSTLSINTPRVSRYLMENGRVVRVYERNSTTAYTAMAYDSNGHLIRVVTQ